MSLTSVAIHKVTPDDIRDAWIDSRPESQTVSFGVGGVDLYFDSLADLEATLDRIADVMATANAQALIEA